MHATSCAPERNWSKWGLMYAKNKSRLSRDKAQKSYFWASTMVWVTALQCIEPEMIGFSS